MKTLPPSKVRVPVTREKIAAVARELAKVDLSPVPKGSGRARGPGTSEGWITGLSMTRLMIEGQFNRLSGFPATASVIGALMTRRSGVPYQVMVNRLDPHGSLDTHRDGIPFEPAPERWHLPVVTNSEVRYIENGEPFELRPDGWWGPIHYWELHSMVNGGEAPRTHLVVDLKVIDSG